VGHCNSANVPLRQHAAWNAQGLDVPRLAINVSEMQIRDGEFVELMLTAVRAATQTKLEIEITESSFRAEGEETIARLDTLRAAGMKISIDDFGTGYLSLSKVAHLPIDPLNIDQGFVHSMLDNQNHPALVTALIAPKQALALHDVAEGVEHEEQTTSLRQLGHTTNQGHLFAPALEGAAAAALLYQRQPQLH